MNGDREIHCAVDRAISRSICAGAGSTPAPEPLLLDTYTGAAAAYSLRKLRTAYTGAAIRVRRSSDNAEQDIGFSGVDLDTAALLSFCGAGNGFVTTWYDQSETGNNATQATTTLQPQIVASGAVLIQGGLAAIQSNAQRLDFTGVSASAFTVCSVAQVQSWGGSAYVSYIANVGPTNGFKIVSRDQTTYRSTLIPYAGTAEVIANARARTTALSLPTSRFVESWSFSPAAMRLNGASQTVDADTLSGWGTVARMSIGAMDYTTVVAGVTNLQEVILFPTNRSADAAAIETNINSYWGVY